MSETLSFEAAQKELEQIVERLERGQPELDEAIRLWERGEELLPPLPGAARDGARGRSRSSRAAAKPG